jgi:hypothetical protein
MYAFSDRKPHLRSIQEIRQIEACEPELSERRGNQVPYRTATNRVHLSALAPLSRPAALDAQHSTSPQVALQDESTGMRTFYLI